MDAFDGFAPSGPPIEDRDLEVFTAEISSLVERGASLAEIRQRCPKLLSTEFIRTASEMVNHSPEGLIRRKLENLISQVAAEDPSSAERLAASFALCDHSVDCDTRRGYLNRMRAIIAQSGYADVKTPADVRTHFRSWRASSLEKYAEYAAKAVFSTNHPKLLQCKTEPVP